ncbi:MAG: flagellar hook protein FlgE [Asticcacaulis sp.]|uniref:flagellar hook protein FlgE n=1 Tax=Asticcacaulis sp. TaxID=1872648 RepID=UPI0039E60C32
MSINSAMQSGVTALAANATALATISNNIANSNTTGYKRVTTSFTDLVSGTSNKHSYTSGGVVSVNRQSNTNQGELNSDTSGYSLGINGQGFFAVSDAAGNVDSSSSLLFTRDGSFTTDTEGNLVNSGGYYLQGWPADSSGNITTSATDANLLAPINVSDLANAASATTAVTFTANLDSNTAISDAVSSGDYDATSAVAASDTSTTPVTYSKAMSIYDASTGAGTKPDGTISASISDSLGQEHTVTISLLKGNVVTDSSDPAYGMTQWYYEVSSDDVTSDNGLNQIDTGSLYFDSNGNLSTDASTYGGTLPNLLSDSGFSIGASSETSGVHWNTDVGADAQAITMGFGTSGTSSITQLAGDTTTKSISANGTEFGSLSNVEISKDGLVTAIYNNGHTRDLAQIAVATFLNPNGLTAVSGNAYKVSTDSGAYSLKVPGENGAGSVEADTLEASTVDIAQEFTGLITTQRAYSAASKIVTTADDMLQELLAIKR